MFKTLRNAFKVKDIRDRILFTFLMLDRHPDRKRASCSGC